MSFDSRLNSSVHRRVRGVRVASRLGGGSEAGIDAEESWSVAASRLGGGSAAGIDAVESWSVASSRLGGASAAGINAPAAVYFSRIRVRLLTM